MARVFIAGQIHPAGMAVLRAEPGLDVEVLDAPGTVLAPDALAQADALLIRYGVLSEADVAQAPLLKVVSRHGVGFDNLPLAAMMLALVKRIGPYDAAVRGGGWAIR